MKPIVIRLIKNSLSVPLRRLRTALHKPYQSLGYMVGVRMGGRDPLIPPASLHSVGSPDFVAAGAEFFRYFVDLCGLEPHERVLDVGC